MRDVLILSFIFFMLCASLARPFLMTIAYIYVDLISPQKITYHLLSSVPFSLIMAILAVVFWLLFDDKKGVRFSGLQALMLLWVAWVTFTTFISQVPDHAWVTWSSAWKSIGFGIFLPFVLRTRQRIEVGLFFVVLCVGVLTIIGGIKTLSGGGGYGQLNLLVESNSGLYEGSTLSAVAVALIPLILYLYRHNTLFPRNWMLKAVTAGLIFSALLIPVGTEARTGLICIAVLGFMVFLKSNRKLVLVVGVVVSAAIAFPFLPKSFTGRMGTIETHKEDSSASTRVAVWAWTWDFVKTHPMGGGFNSYLLNNVEYELQNADGTTQKVVDKARAFHSAYFATLGEHGYPGFLIYMSMLITSVVQMFGVARRMKAVGPEEAWIRDLSIALAQTIIIYMAGSLFVGIAYQSTLYTLFAFCVATGNMASLYRRGAVLPAPPGGRPQPVMRSALAR